MNRHSAPISDDAKLDFQFVRHNLCVGDVIFIRSRALPFRKVAEATNSWTNHVGIVIDTTVAMPLIAESTFPFSKATPLSQFAARSDQRRIAIKRLRTPLTDRQKQALRDAARKRFGIFYDTGFNIRSRRQFCSRFVREVLMDATGHAVGEIEDFRRLLSHNPHAGLAFWRVWYFGSIPWSRKTVTPASLLESPDLQTVMQGHLRQELISSKSFNLLHA